MKKIYFAGSIRGGRNDRELYKQIIDYLQNFGEVLTEHVGEGDVLATIDLNKTSDEIYNRDLKWLMSSDLVVVEVSTPSLGVGFEIAKAIEFNKKILCLYRVQENKILSAMIAGCPGIEVVEYKTFEDVKNIIDNFIKS